MAFQVDVADDATWDRDIIGAPGILHVVEVYQDWAGPCKAAMSVLKRLFFDLGERPLKMWTANAKKATALAKYRGHCEPAFLLIKDGTTVRTIQGIQAPVLSREVEQLSLVSAKA